MASASPSIAASARAVAPAPAPKAIPFDLEKPVATAKLALTRLSSKRIGVTQFSALARGSGGGWLVPSNAGPRDALFLIDEAGAVTEPWSSPTSVHLRFARDGADGLFVAGVPTSKTVFGFSHLERVFRLSKSGRIGADSAFDAGIFRPTALAGDASSAVLAVGTLAGPLTTATGPLVPEAGGRAEVLLRLSNDGPPKWAVALKPTSGQASMLAVGPDGASVVVSSPSIGEQLLTAFSPTGSLLWEKRVTPSPGTPRFGSSAVEQIVSDGGGGYFVAGGLGSEGGLDFGLGPFSGDGTFVARLDAKGECLWERSLPPYFEISGDGAGSILAAPGWMGGTSVYEIDSEARVKRAVSFDLGSACQSGDHPVGISEKGSLTPSTLLVVITCQQLDDGYRPPQPVGKPAVLAGSLSRK